MMNEENANEKDQDNGQRVWTTAETLPMLQVTFPMLQESRMNGRKGLDEFDPKEMDQSLVVRSVLLLAAKMTHFSHNAISWKKNAPSIF